MAGQHRPLDEEGGARRVAPITRRTFCRSALLGLAGLTSQRVFAAASAPRPNILLITADDLGPYLGCYGDSIARTSNLDRLAAEGVRFERAFVTHASCSPSRSSIFTGLYPHQNGQIGLAHLGYSMREGMRTLPALLKQAGYRTGVIGKIHVAPDSAFPFDWKGGLKVADTRDVRLVAERAGDFMSQSAGPFFLMANYFDPHRPLAHQVKGVPQQPFASDGIKPFPFLGLDTPQIREEVAGYYNCAARFDVGVGMLLDRLAQAGHGENTIVIVLGDHGPPFTRAKTTCYEAGLHIPLIVRWPGRAKAGLASGALVSTVDILPTVLDGAGIELPAPIAGRSLVPLLRGKDVPWRETLCAEYTSHGPRNFYPRRAIRDARHKLILNLLPDRPNPVLGVDGCAAWAASRDPDLDGTMMRGVYDTYHHPSAVELYDLDNDPNEFHNLAGRPEHAAVENRLRRQLEQWREETNDPLVDPEALAALTREHDALPTK